MTGENLAGIPPEMVLIELRRIADSLERIAVAQEQMANDDPLSRIERALSRPMSFVPSESPEGESLEVEGADDLWERGFRAR
jgi:hypothetical protein